MTATVDYYFATVSPWAYLGHARFVAIARAAGDRARLRRCAPGRRLEAATRCEESTRSAESAAGSPQSDRSARAPSATSPSQCRAAPRTYRGVEQARG